jgi:hypothetical protein
MDYLIGLSIKEAKDLARRELGLKRLGDARFQMLLEEGVSKGIFQIEGGQIVAPSSDSLDVWDDLLEEESAPSHIEASPSLETSLEEETSTQVNLETLPLKPATPAQMDVSGKLKSELPRSGDLYYYQSYQGGVVQGEVKGVYCFVEVINPDGTYQSLSLSEIAETKKALGKCKKTPKAYVIDNMALRAERDRLLREIEALRATLDED